MYLGIVAETKARIFVFVFAYYAKNSFQRSSNDKNLLPGHCDSKGIAAKFTFSSHRQTPSPLSSTVLVHVNKKAQNIVEIYS